MPKRPTSSYTDLNADPPDDAAPSTPASPSAPTPLAIILETMRRKYAGGDLDGAVALARIAAPYLHPKIPSATPPADLTAMHDADLDALQTPD